MWQIFLEAVLRQKYMNKLIIRCDNTKLTAIVRALILNTKKSQQVIEYVDIGGSGSSKSIINLSGAITPDMDLVSRLLYGIGTRTLPRLHFLLSGFQSQCLTRSIHSHLSGRSDGGGKEERGNMKSLTQIGKKPMAGELIPSKARLLHQAHPIPPPGEKL
jgi:hypothetical protein